MSRKLDNRIYIAGRVTGEDYEETAFKFAQAEKMLKDKGYQVVNPMNEIEQGTDWNNAMRQCIIHLCTCGFIYLLEDWMDSRGAKLEKTIAEGLEIIAFRASKDEVPEINNDDEVEHIEAGEFPVVDHSIDADNNVYRERNFEHE